jgi:23S rRNA maturation mini-RNase III
MKFEKSELYREQWKNLSQEEKDEIVERSKNGKLENPKIFSVSFEYELEDAERIGGEVYKNAVGNAVFNVMCEECIIANSNLAKQKIEKEQTKEIKRKQKRSKENKRDQKKTKTSIS